VAGAEDVAVCTYDLWHTVASDWPSTDIDAVHTAYVAFWDFLKANVYTDNVKLKELRYYDDYNGDGSPGAADRVTSVNTAGFVTGNMCPPQVAISVTEILSPATETRRRWGRFYLPAPAVSLLAEDGTLGSGFVSAIADAVQTLYNAWTTATYFPIVWVGRPEQLIAQVDQIRIDEILDVQRRRRYESTQIRQTRAIT
jgi:hypothetical protein